MKLHNIFHPKLLRRDLRDPLPSQIQNIPGKIVPTKGEEEEIADITKCAWHPERLQYRCEWLGEENRPLDWYNTDRREFQNAKEITGDYHQLYALKISHTSTIFMRAFDTSAASEFQEVQPSLL